MLLGVVSIWFDKVMRCDIRKVYDEFLKYRQLVFDFLLKRNESLERALNESKRLHMQ